MTFNLTVDFEFLCAFAPPAPFAQGPKNCWVVLPDLTGVQEPFRAHYPCVVYDRHHRVADIEIENEGKKPRPPAGRQDRQEFVMCEGESIEIRPNGDPMTANNLGLDGDLPHVMRIATAGVGLEQIDARLIEKAKPDRVAARLQLNAGTLSEGALTDIDFELSKGGSTIHVGKIARRVSLALLDLNHVDFVFRRFSNDAERILRLRTSFASSEVKIRNCEEEFIWLTDMPPYDAQASDEINQFFRLAADYDAGDPPPYVTMKARNLLEGPSGVCAPKAFDGWKAVAR